MKFGDLPEPDPYVIKLPCSPEAFEEVANAKTAAWPPRRSKLLWRAGRLIGRGPPKNAIAWLGRADPLTTMRDWQKHQALDALGALAAALPPRRIMTGTFWSHQAGHQHDVALLRNIERVGLEDIHLKSDRAEFAKDLR